jgi:hypothetical protein
LPLTFDRSCSWGVTAKKHSERSSKSPSSDPVRALLFQAGNSSRARHMDTRAHHGGRCADCVCGRCVVPQNVPWVQSSQLGGATAPSLPADRYVPLWQRQCWIQASRSAANTRVELHVLLRLVQEMTSLCGRLSSRWRASGRSQSCPPTTLSTRVRPWVWATLSLCSRTTWPVRAAGAGTRYQALAGCAPSHDTEL